MGLSRILFCLLLVVPLARADQAGELAQIHLEAIGGAKRIAAIQALRISGVVLVGDRRVKFTMLAARPNRVRLETGEEGHKVINVSDGSEPPWAWDSGARPARYRLLSEAEAKAFTAEAEFDDPLIAGAARGFRLEFTGEAELDGRKMLRVLVTRNFADTLTLLIDPETYFILQRGEQRVTADGRRQQIVTRYDDFRPVESVLLPHKITLLTDGRIDQQMIIERIETNPALAPEMFSRPKAATTAAKELP